MELNKVPTIIIGSDPEVFVRDKKSGQFICPEGLIKGNKKEPYTEDRFNGIHVQVDGMALEFNIPPVTSHNYFHRYISNGLNILGSLIPNDLELVIAPSATFDPEYWENIPRHMKRIGCDPDWNAYTRSVNKVPEELQQSLTRYAGGHIHIGWRSNGDAFSPAHLIDCFSIVKELDYVLGAQSIIWDTDMDRRKFYGRLGNFRPKPYGLEYRTLSNAWMKSPTLITFVFNTVTTIVHDAFKGRTGYYAESPKKFISHLEKIMKTQKFDYDYLESINMFDVTKYL